jgi:hypothetical protein
MHLNIQFTTPRAFDDLLRYFHYIERNASHSLNDIRDVTYILTACTIAFIFAISVIIYNICYLLLSEMSHMGTLFNRTRF